MKEALERIADFAASVEARLAAQEAKIAGQAAQLAAQEAQIIALSKRIAELEARPVVTESEVVIDMEEDVPEVVETPEVIEAPQVVETPEPVVAPAPAKPEVPSPEPEPEPQRPATNEQRPAAGSPVDDLRQAISLGDRFLFQRELFGQNGELMQKTIDALNKQADLNSAVAYLDKHFNWNQESTAYELFLNALHRRFG